MKKTILLVMVFAIFAQSVFGHSKEVHDLHNLYYLDSSYDSEMLISEMERTINEATTAIEKQTVKNIVVVLKMRINIAGSETETHNMLKETLAENDPLLSEKDPDYITSVADLMLALVDFSSFIEVMKLSANSSELYEKAIEIDPNHFSAFHGYGLGTVFRPPFVGGGAENAMPLFKQAEKNAQEEWEKYVIFAWLSQVYLEMGDTENHEKYKTLAEDMSPDGSLLAIIKALFEESE